MAASAAVVAEGGRAAAAAVAVVSAARPLVSSRTALPLHRSSAAAAALFHLPGFAARPAALFYASSATKHAAHSLSNRYTVRCMSTQGEIAKLEGQVVELAQEHPVQLFTKTYCPYSKRVKQLFTELRVPYHHLDLDLLDNEDLWQDALLDLTGKRTVPSVWIGGKCVGGCDDTLRLYKSSALTQLLEDAGVPIPEA
eukprot:jgi/Chlat1/5540/Chrsp369S00842